MARTLIFRDEKAGYYLGEFPRDALVGFVNTFRGIRRKLCSIADVDCLPVEQRQDYLGRMYQIKQLEIINGKTIEANKAKKSRQTKRNQTVLDAKNMWIKELEITNSPKTLVMYEQSLQLYVAACGNHPLKNLERQHGIDFLAHLKKCPGQTKGSKMAPTTQKKHLRQFKVFLTWAYDNEIIDKLIRIKSPRTQKKDMETFTLDELTVLKNALLDGIENASSKAEKIKYTNLFRAFMLATTTLLRVAPIWSLQLHNIDLEKRVIKIRDNEKIAFKNKSMKWPNKPINEDLYNFLKQDLENRGPKEKYYLDKGDGSLWRWDRGDISRQMSIVCKSAGLPKLKPFHEGMRATLITELLKGGMKVEVVQMLADHSNIATTLLYNNTRTTSQELAAQELPHL